MKDREGCEGERESTLGGGKLKCRSSLALGGVLQIPNQLHFFTKIGDFLHARCKKSLLDVKNLPVAFIAGISNISLDADLNADPSEGRPSSICNLASTHFIIPR
jgi:hypothetical protein